jgi:hypothetical protein
MIEHATDLESLKMWFWAVLGLMIILVAIVGYFIKNRDSEIKNRDFEIKEMLNSMSKVVTQLEKIVSNIEINQTIRQPILDQQLEIHRKGIEENAHCIEKIDLRLTTIEAEHKICKYSGK